ncbi:hypothetical protein KEM60_01541 [Austwickia sp. TVS 96-490-7B]|nr:hypothetical protein [Austwickia sp. TVS 96-490-7B]
MLPEFRVEGPVETLRLLLKVVQAKPYSLWSVNLTRRRRRVDDSEGDLIGGESEIDVDGRAGLCIFRGVGEHSADASTQPVLHGSGDHIQLCEGRRESESREFFDAAGQRRSDVGAGGGGAHTDRRCLRSFEHVEELAEFGEGRPGCRYHAGERGLYLPESSRFCPVAESIVRIVRSCATMS